VRPHQEAIFAGRKAENAVCAVKDPYHLSVKWFRKVLWITETAVHEFPLKPIENALGLASWQPEGPWVRLHVALFGTGLPKSSAGDGQDYGPQIEGVIEPERWAKAHFLIFQAAYPIGLKVTEQSHG
jgi:hypothetical protein